MTNTFKPGERVRVTHRTWPRAGEIGEVESVGDGNVEVEFLEDDGSFYVLYRADELEKVEDTK
jgi:hypothetical protein